jgi:hypothetical protein
MKKVLEKVISIVLAAISLLFVIVLLVVMFNEDLASRLHEETLARAFVIVFSIIFAVLTTTNILLAFKDNDKVNQILLFRTKESASRATISVVKRLAKKAALNIKGMPIKKQTEGKGTKLQHIVLTADANGDVTFTASVRCVTDKVEPLLEKVRAELVVTFGEVLGLNFKAIDLFAIAVKNDYKADKGKVDKVFDKFIESRQFEDDALASKPAAQAPATEEAAAEAEEIVEIEEVKVENFEEVDETETDLTNNE